MERVADVPAHGESNRDPSDFALTNKNLVCCYVCRLIKSRNQFHDSGCDNCKNLFGPSISFEDYTTPNFSGMISIMDPKASWACKWLHLGRYVPGCYAMAVNDDVPDDLQDILENKGIKVRHG
ncbi:hypothetical protein VOLCADRAFT_107303 [Volvox carteri f. nagariensis]|uniref:Spt4/RpoE2 zinc finger domain-containing protein n=1 Tax=Volvox carteri f. nagariensis TaxID=3068 RepID=D8UD44_VOLCA|nr:uncharacterized protein VOLCADRAFT_107303 [Volvox carteri f. nagariensis]EFJ42329.1 hypothetical protein VOLCADRAFT_107303 [Volvox carteri f. nagariensis]|eukprot:XP_002956562.1 hypothetical protein VOLCADRAFT_107303 [Volvox carteri f. nagariensis]